MAVLLIPTKRLMQDSTTYAVLGTLKKEAAGYIMGITAHLHTKDRRAITALTLAGSMTVPS